MKNPCKGCEDRHPNCHTKDCPHGWYEWDKEHREKRNRIWKEQQILYRPSDFPQFKNKDKGGS